MSAILLIGLSRVVKIGNNNYMMTKNQKITLLVLRMSLGWMFFYAGITKILNPEWSAKGYLLGTKTFVGLFHWFANPGVLPVVDFLNEWGLTLLGVSLILGIWTRASSIFGSILMLLYYVPVLEFPMAGSHSYIVEEHIIYILVLALFAVLPRSSAWNIRDLFKWIVGSYKLVN